MKHVPVTVIVLFLVFAFVPSVAVVADTPFDSQSLVGEWEGSWTWMHINDRIYISIFKVKGAVVEGKVEAMGSQCFREEKFKGMLEGNTLKIETSRASATLVISDGKMKGTSRCDRDSSVELTKKK